MTPRRTRTSYLGSFSAILEGMRSTAVLVAILHGACGFAARFQGAIDEVRIHDQVLPVSWIATEFANLTSSTFVIIDPQQQQS